MSSAVTSLVCTALFALCTAASAASAASAGDKRQPPKYVNEPLLGLRLDADVKLDLLPEEVRAKCEQIADNEKSTARWWIFASTFDTATAYYVVGGYSKMRYPEPGRPLYVPSVRGGLILVTGDKCVGDPADAYFEGPTEEVPLPILQQLSRNLAARLVRAVGGPDKLRIEIRNQRIDFDTLSPELQDAFRPYFPAATR